MRLLALASMCATSLLAYDAAVTGPTTGFLWNNGAVRPILGVPGAARLGNVVAPGLHRAAISPKGDYALGCVDDKLVRVDLASAEATAIGDCPNTIAISPTGASAALVYPDFVRLLRGNEIAIRASVCAVNDSGSMLLCSSENALLAVDTVSGASRTVLPGSAVAAFRATSNNAVVADQSKIYDLRNGGELIPLAEFEGATSIAVLDDTLAVVASRQARKLALVPMAGGALDIVDTPVEPLALTGLEGSRTLHLMCEEAGPSWLVVRDGPSARLMFVPAAEEFHE